MSSYKPNTEHQATAPLSDFEEMMQLAQNDPEAFEEERRRQIQAFLDSVPEEKRRRLVGLQWRVDQIRKLAPTPMASCIALSNMMKESLQQLRTQQLKLLGTGLEANDHYQEEVPVGASILPFTRH